jgi:serine/threonine-protein kinase
VGRYALFGEIASGGMATVHFGRLLGPAGFSRAVAVKRLHPQLAKEAEFVSMFIDEVRLAARVQHPNVVATLDVVEDAGELFLVMEYVHGESLAQLVRAARTRGLRVPPAIASSIVCGVLHGLHAAHEARSETGEPLGIIHRDVSPQNVLVGADGVARVLDFGIARAARRLQSTTREGQLKGKAAYLAPERIHGHEADRRSDVYGAAVLLWESLTGATLFDGENDAAVLAQIVSGQVPPPSSLAPDIPPALEAITLAGMDRDPAKRFGTAREMALALQQGVGLVAPSEVGDWVTSIAADQLAERARYLSRLGEMPGEAPVLDAKRPGSWRPGEPRTRRVPQSDAPRAADSLSAASDSPLASPAPTEASQRGRKWLFGVLTVLAGLSSGAAFVLRQKPTLPPEGIAPVAHAAPADVSPNSNATSTVAAPLVTSPVDLLQPTAEASPPDTAHASGSALPSKGAVPRRRSPAKAGALAKAPDADHATVAPAVDPPPRDACQPPYTVDSAGVKHFKVDCVIDGRR